MIQRVLLFVCLAFALPALAEDAKAKAAREELERQLNQMVAKQPSRVRIDLAALDEPNYQLEEASFELDGRSLGSPSVSQLMREGEHLVWSGDVTPGKHTVKVLLVYANGTSIVVSDEGGYKWRVGGAVSFDVHAGIEVRVTAKPARDSMQADISKRFKISLPAKPVMIAEVDDGKMPEPVKPVVVPAPVVDAGQPGLTAAETAEQAKLAAAAEQKRKADEAAEAKRLAAEEQKRKAAEAAEAKQQQAAAALEAKRLAAEEKKQKAAAALEANRLAAEERKRQAAAALEAKRLAAEEKKRQAAEALALSKLSAEERAQKAAEAQRLAEEQKAILRAAADGQKPIAMVATDPAPAVEDGGAPPVAIVPAAVDAGVDAGVTVIVSASPDAGAPVAAAPTPATPESEGPPWLLIGLGGGLAAIVLLVVLARRSARPPTIDD